MDTIARNIFQYLIQHQLLTQKALVDGGMVLTMQRSRNRFISVKQKLGVSYFIKQAIETEPMSAVTVAREASIYQGAFGDDRLAALKSLLPKFHFFSENDGVLITELINDSTNLSMSDPTQGSCNPVMAEKLGHAIASVHQIRFATDKPQADIFPKQPPWILHLHQQTDLSSLRRSPACIALIDLLLRAPSLEQHLGDLYKSWERDTLIHTDLKWDNCLVSPQKSPLAEQQLHIIDWELADIGDAAWDVGSIFQAYLNLWVTSITPAPDTPFEEIVAKATIPVELVQASIGQFWRAYVKESQHSRTPSTAFLQRCVKMMAARMLVTAFEGSAKCVDIDGRALFLIQTAINVLERPDKAIQDLLGLGDSL